MLTTGLKLRSLCYVFSSGKYIYIVCVYVILGLYIHKICKFSVPYKYLYPKLSSSLRGFSNEKNKELRIIFSRLTWKILKILGYSVSFIKIITIHLIQTYFLVSVQNGSIHQKDAVNDDDFEPYLSSQTNQGLRRLVFWHSTEMLQVCLGETWGG